jgi:hypothetical protein
LARQDCFPTAVFEHPEFGRAVHPKRPCDRTLSIVLIQPSTRIHAAEFCARTILPTLGQKKRHFLWATSLTVLGRSFRTFLPLISNFFILICPTLAQGSMTIKCDIQLLVESRTDDSACDKSKYFYHRGGGLQCSQDKALSPASSSRIHTYTHLSGGQVLCRTQGHRMRAAA